MNVCQVNVDLTWTHNRQRNCLLYMPVLLPSACSDERIEDFVRGKLGKGLPTRSVPVEVLGQHMTQAGEDFGAVPLGKCWLGQALVGIEHSLPMEHLGNFMG